MKKLILVIGILFLSASAFAQKKDSVVTKQPTDTLYYVVGKIENFQLLYAAVKSPGDVTPNQVAALLVWIEKNVAMIPKEENKK